ncbi:hypothetical protein F4678DRAFT_461104 [Xylaria arbuscula]|nr:hypothetical protein F4678DRAFT_461104 [Xylaria arbuscula]
MSIRIENDIFQPNVSDPLSIQYDWAVNDVACLRPTTEYDVPIVCKVIKSYEPTPFLPTLGTEYDAFAKCCNRTASNRNETQWILINPCDTEYCFTNDQAMAENFDLCIVDTAKAEYKELGINGTAAQYRGRCEYIDYDSIKKGVRLLNSAAGLAPPWVVLGIGLAAVSICMSFL